MPTKPTPERWRCKQNWTWSDNRFGGYRVWTVRPGTILLITSTHRSQVFVEHPDGTRLQTSRVSLIRNCTREPTP